MGISTATGCKIFIGTTVAAENLSQYLSDTYVEVGEVEDLGEFGDSAEDVTFASLADSRLRHLKGIRDAGVLSVICGSDSSDAGQAAMIAAEASTLDFNFKVTLNDQLTLLGTPTEQYFSGKVMSKRLGVGQANNVVRRTFNVGINTEILEIPAT